MNKKILFISFILCLTFFYLSPLEVPYLYGRVNDYAKILDDNTIALLEKRLADYEKETTNQIVVLTIKSLEGENLEEFSIKTVEKWKLGVKGKDNGVLLLIAIDDRKLRIEVGYGLEGSLTDSECGQIIRNRITPYFKKNDYKTGIIQGVNSIINVIGGKDDLKESVEANNQIEKNKLNLIDNQMDDMDIFTRILLGLFIFGIIGLFTIIGILGSKGFPGWFLYFFLIPFWAIFPAIIVGFKNSFIIVVIYLIGYPLAKILVNIGAKHFTWIRKFQKSFGSSGGGSYSGGHYSSGSSSSYSGSSSSSSSSSSFSGGGGSFGGGGASGSW